MRFPVAALAVALFSVAACGRADAPRAMLDDLAPSAGLSRTADFIGPDGAGRGRITVTEGTGGIVVRFDLEGLAPGWHAAHLHEVADCSDAADGFKASKGHVNPDGLAHGLLNPDGAERADLPNIFAGPDGRATAEIFRSGVALTASEAAAGSGAHPLLDADGFAVIVHESADDHTTQPIGGAGGRIACAAFPAS